jgi:hypothetical protein
MYLWTMYARHDCDSSAARRTLCVQDTPRSTRRTSYTPVFALPSTPAKNTGSASTPRRTTSLVVVEARAGARARRPLWDAMAAVNVQGPLSGGTSGRMEE